MGVFVNVPFHSTPGEWCVVSIFCFVLVWGGGLQGEPFYMSPIGQCPLTVSVPYLIRAKYGLLHRVHRYIDLEMAVWFSAAPFTNFIVLALSS